MVHIRTLNLQHGGGKRAVALGEYLSNAAADILVLSEFRENRSGWQIRDCLANKGYGFWATSHPGLGTNGVAVAAKRKFTPLAHPAGDLPDQARRWLECDFTDFRLVATYFPGGKPKLDYWRWFLEQARARSKTNCVLVGDFNTGKHRIDEVGSTFFGPEYMEAMEADGWIDAWRQLNAEGREYTWKSQGTPANEFRLDYAWISGPMAGRLKRAAHDHSPRTNRITDHSALYVELASPVR